MRSVVAEVSLDGLVLNGRLFDAPVAPAEYCQILQECPRTVEPPTPAPYGFRNNQIHLFDDAGLYLIEHHARRLVDAVEFVLWLDEATFKPAKEFSGSLTVGDVSISPGVGPEALHGGSIQFEGPLLGLWMARKDGISICMRGTGARLPSGRRGRRLRFVGVSVCYSATGA